MGSNHPKGRRSRYDDIDPTQISQLLEAMHQKLINHMKAVFLVGGFGASQYLKMRLEKANTDIQVIQPPDA
jgi:hypothetical protein